jgi:molybdopterin molybdotransferase/putative molybdopterin biosynthesis protein
MDGIAVRSSAFAAGIPDTAYWQPGEDYCRADTGDDFDDRFDAVIPIEHVSLLPDGALAISPEANVTHGMHIRPRGSDVSEGDLLIRKGRQIRPFDLACLSLGGITRLEVYRKPRVAFLPTGSELVPAGTIPLRGQTVESNSILARHMLMEMGAEALIFPIVPDDRFAAETAMDGALASADIVVVSGGSSKGEEDYNARILEERGAALFHQVAAAPGRPMCVALIGGKPVINLSGPPLAVFFGMDWCVRAMVHRLLCKPMPLRQRISAILTEDISAPPDMEILYMMDLRKNGDGYEARPTKRRGGHIPESLGAGAIYIKKLGISGHTAGEELEIELLRGEEDFQAMNAGTRPHSESMKGHERA